MFIKKELAYMILAEFLVGPHEPPLFTPVNENFWVRHNNPNQIRLVVKNNANYSIRNQ